MPGVRLLIAADTNVLLDLALGTEAVMDALETLRERLPEARLVVPATGCVNLPCQKIRQNERKRKAAAAPIIATPREIVRKFCR